MSVCVCVCGWVCGSAMKNAFCLLSKKKIYYPIELTLMRGHKINSMLNCWGTKAHETTKGVTKLKAHKLNI